MAQQQGPKVQVPTSLQEIIDQDGKVKQEWATFFHALQQTSHNGTRSGPTASRPTDRTLRWVGMPYFDTDLGKSVYLKIASSNTWVDGSGTPV